MPLQEITEVDLLHHLPHAKGKEAILFITVLCGTCKLAERMLDIVLAASVQTEMRTLKHQLRTPIERCMENLKRALPCNPAEWRTRPVRICDAFG